eukprot:scaffold766_cov167-Ochromonas_danica.AAC.8
MSQAKHGADSLQLSKASETHHKQFLSQDGEFLLSRWGVASLLRGRESLNLSELASPFPVLCHGMTLIT